MRPRCLLALAAVMTVACQRGPSGGAKASPGGGVAPAISSGVAEAKALLDAGKPDEALAKLAGLGEDADTLYYQGLCWAKKAETAPLPTPPPLPSPPVRGAPPPAAPEFKPEELKALEFLDKAAGLRPDRAPAHLAVAELLGPHAARRHDLEEAAKNAKSVRRGKAPTPPPSPEEGPDFSVDRVLQSYRAALQADRTGREPTDALYRFAVRVGRLDDADAALREMVKRDAEKPEPLVRYGDFLAAERKDPHGAVEQYRQALMWRPDDDVTRGKIADIYINLGIDSYSRQEYAAAESRFREAQKYITDVKSPQGVRVHEYMAKLGGIRKLPPSRR